MPSTESGAIRNQVKDKKLRAIGSGLGFGQAWQAVDHVGVVLVVANHSVDEVVVVVVVVCLKLGKGLQASAGVVMVDLVNLWRRRRLNRLELATLTRFVIMECHRGGDWKMIAKSATSSSGS